MMTEETDKTRRIRARKEFLSSLPRDEYFKRGEGIYFSSMETFWSTRSEAVDDNWYNDIVRTEEQGHHLYEAAVLDTNLVHPLAASGPSSKTNTEQSDVKFDMFENYPSEAAHLFSDAPVCDKGYGFLGQAATGKVMDSAEGRLKLLNGVKPAAAVRRIDHSGLKHHKYNKMYLYHHKVPYDSKPPSILVIPVLPLNRILGWNGTEDYFVMAVTFGEDAEKWASEILKPARQICTEIEIEECRKVLETFLKGIASSVKQHPVKESFGRRQFKGRGRKDPAIVAWGKLKDELEHGVVQLVLPQKGQDVDWSSVRVAKAIMSLRSSLPDPFLVAVKAAINYSAHQGQKLMPACSERESGTYSDGDVNTAQGRDDEEHRDNDNRSFAAIAASLGNPNRQQKQLYCEDA